MKAQKLTLEERTKFSMSFSDERTRDDYVNWLLDVIEKTDSEEKVEYIANLTSAYALEFIPRELYIRLIGLVLGNLSIDLCWLKDNCRVSEQGQPVSSEFKQLTFTIQGLMSVGLMWQSSLTDTVQNGPVSYSVTKLGFLLDKFGLSYRKKTYHYNADEHNDLKPERQIPTTRFSAFFS